MTEFGRLGFGLTGFGAHGQFSKKKVPFGSPIVRHPYTKDLKGDPNLENYPHGKTLCVGFAFGGLALSSYLLRGWPSTACTRNGPPRSEEKL